MVRAFTYIKKNPLPIFRNKRSTRRTQKNGHTKETMKTKLIIVLLIFCFSENGKTYSQNIKISYHLGYDCSTEINGKVVRGGCVTNERLEYTPKKGGKYFESNKLELERKVRQYENGGFGKNLEADSLKKFRLSKKITLKAFIRLIDYLKLVESAFDNKTDAAEYLQKKVISKWDKNTFDLTKIEIKIIQRRTKKRNGHLSVDSLIQIINKYIKEANEGFISSSTVEFLNISFEHEKKKYSISQNNLGGVNVSWQIEIEDKRYFVVSPELNKMISPFLSKKMAAKKAINQFLKIEALEGAFNLAEQSIE